MVIHVLVIWYIFKLVFMSFGQLSNIRFDPKCFRGVPKTLTWLKHSVFLWFAWHIFFHGLAGFVHRFHVCVAHPHLCVDHMFWPHAVVPFMLSAGPYECQLDGHRWTQWGAAYSRADTPASRLIDTFTEWMHITQSHQGDFCFIHWQWNDLNANLLWTHVFRLITIQNLLTQVQFANHGA